MWRLCCGLLSLCLLAGCQPMYETRYNYTPPAGRTAKMCVAQCIQGKSSCEQFCQMSKQNCRLAARQDAMIRQMSRLPDTWPQDDCDAPCNCVMNFNACYSACGGSVTEQSVCVAFCDQT